jgi:putative membrane protein
MSIRVARGMAVLGSCALWAACAKGGSTADSAAMADSASRAGAAAPSAAAAAPAAMTDTSIFALLDEANAHDSAGGNMASTKGTASSVKEFGRLMMKDHHTLRKSGQDLAKKLKITPAPPAGDTLPAAAQRTSDSLTAAPKGAAWDKMYIDHAVAEHQAVLSMLQNAQTAATDTSLKAAIAKAIPIVQNHLTKGQDIQGKLPAANAAGAAGAGTAAGGAAATNDSTKKKSP